MKGWIRNMGASHVIDCRHARPDEFIARGWQVNAVDSKEDGWLRRLLFVARNLFVTYTDCANIPQ
jgi:hypothetical protein